MSTTTVPEPPEICFRALADARVRPKERAAGDSETEARYEITISSDAPVEIWPGEIEILGHEPGEIRLDYFQSGNAPVLWMHDRKDGHIGRIDGVRVNKGVMSIEVVLGHNDLALQKRKDLEADILRNSSIGYRVHRWELQESDEDKGTTTWRVTDWTPIEGSFVTIGADDSVGIRSRSDAARKSYLDHLKQQASHTRQHSPSNAMSKPNSATQDPPPTEPQGQTRSSEPQVKIVRENDPEALRKATDDAVSADRKRMGNIRLLGKQWSETTGEKRFAEEAEKACTEGTSAEEFRDWVLDELGKRNKLVSGAEIGLTEKELKRFSVWNVMDDLTSGRANAAFEREVSDEIRKRTNRSNLNDNIALPAEVYLSGVRFDDPTRAARWNHLVHDPVKMRDLMSVSLTGGGQSDTVSQIVDTEFHDEMFIDALRENTVFLDAGVTIIGGLRGDIEIPIELLSPEMYWVGEDAEPTEGNYQLGRLKLEFKTIAGRVPFTRQAFKQSTPQIENLLVNNIRRGVSIGMDRAGINGAGSTTVPEGILNCPGIGSVASNAGVVEYTHLLQLEEALGNANADTSRAQLFTNSHGKRLLLETPKFGNTSN